MQEYIRPFREVLPGMMNLDHPTHFLLITGEAGSGKSSLLNVYKKLCQDEGLVVHELTPRLGMAARTLPRELQALVIPHAKEAKKGLFRRPFRSKEIPEITNRTDPLRLAQALVKELKKHEFSPEVRIFIFIDHLERFVNSEFTVPLAFLAHLGKELKAKKIPVFLVGAIEQGAYHQVEANVELSPFITLPRLNPKDADHFLLAKGPSIMKKEELRVFCLQSSDRTPFTLMFAIDLVNWAIQVLRKEKKVREIANPALITSKIDYFLKKMDLEEFISRVFSLSLVERQLLTMFLDVPRNVISFHELRQQVPDFQKPLQRLVELGLIYVEEEAKLACLTSQSLHVKSRTQRIGVTTDAATTEIEVLLQLIEAEILSGVRPTRMLLMQLKKILDYNNLSPKEARQVAETTEKLLESAVLQEFHDDAHQFALIAGNMLNVAGKHALAGKLYENAAMTFIKLKKDHIAVELLKKSLHSHEKANQPQKVHELAEATINIYLNRAMLHLQQKPPQTQLARANYYQALKMIPFLEESERQQQLQRILKHVERTHAKDDELKQERLSFFTSLIEMTK